jgi:hypothetical protein
MGRGRQGTSQGSSILYGPKARVQRRPLALRVREWAVSNPVGYAREVAFLDLRSGAYDSFMRIVEEKAGDEHDDVREGHAEVVVDKVSPSEDGEISVHYTLSELGDEELTDDPSHVIILAAEEIRDEEIIELVSVQLEAKHREAEVELPR